MDQQTMILLAIGAVVLIGFGVYAIRDASRRRHNPVAPKRSGCQCQQQQGPQCISAIECSRPVSSPVAIHGLSCDPNDPQFVSANDVQAMVYAINEQTEQDRAEQSMERFESAFERMRKSNPPPKKSRGST